jgi:hypothetical protein
VRATRGALEKAGKAPLHCPSRNLSSCAAYPRYHYLAPFVEDPYLNFQENRSESLAA